MHGAPGQSYARLRACLLSDAQAALDGARGLAANGHVGRASATPNGATPAVEQGQLHPMLTAHLQHRALAWLGLAWLSLLHWAFDALAPSNPAAVQYGLASRTAKSRRCQRL